MHKTLLTWMRLVRVKQWTKNAVVFAAFLFALGDRQQNLSWLVLWKAGLAAFLFCLLSSAVYILNDIRDVEQDRAHPNKRRRPIAAGEIAIAPALAAAALFLVITFYGAYRISTALPLVLLAYLLLQVAYTFFLKRIPLLDVLVIATGFVLRAVAGAVAILVPISPWLLICTFLLAIFLGLCKRRHEKVNTAGSETRAVLAGYTPMLLDSLIAMSGAATIVTYAIYTLWPETVEKFGTQWLCATLPFVLFGIFRYMYLVYQADQGDRPEQILLSDIPILSTVALYGAALLAILHFH